MIRTIETKTSKIALRDFNIPRFFVDVNYDPYPSEVNVENEFDCNTQSLRECKIDDFTTVLGCREMAVRCVHFDDDTEYHSDGNIVVIPKNKDKNTGYALAVVSLADSCNAYHGDLVLVAANVESSQYMLICLCKNPGYIGNDHVLGNCTTVNICNKKIDDINKPLSQINCTCETREKNVRYDDGLPVCKPMLVKEANEKFSDWYHLIPWKSNRIARLEIFNSTIRDNLNTTHLLDPCQNSILDASIPITDARYNDRIKSCYFEDNGIPIRIGVLDGNSKTLDGAIHTKDSYKSLRLVDNVAGKRRLINIRTIVPVLDATNDAYVNLPPDVGLGSDSQLLLKTNADIFGGWCEGEWPTYHCWFFGYTRDRIFGIPRAGYRSIPGSFLWNTDDWEAAERCVSAGMTIHRDDGVSLFSGRFAARDNWKYYGFGMSSKRNGMLSFVNDEDYRKHKNVLT